MSRPGWLPPTNEELKDDGPSSPDNTHRKIAVKDALRNKYSIYTPFPPTTRYAEQRAPRNLPFSLSSIGENRKPRSSNVASKLAAYRYDSTSPEPQQQTNDDPRSTTPTRQLRERKAKQFKLEPSSEEEEEEEDVAAGHQNLGRKRRRLNRSLDSDDEDDPMDYDDGDSAYVDEKELKAKMQDKTTPDVDRTMILERLFPHVSHERILEVLDMAGGSQVRASQILSGQKKPESMSPSTSPVAPRHKLTRLRRGRRDASSDDDDDDDEEEISYKDHRKNIEETRKMIQTVRFYNKATSQEIQDVTGCTPEQAEKLSKRRPFADIDQLREVLQQEKGLSVKFISAYVDMMDGYTVVDQIIEQIEDLGTELKQIIDVWKGSQGTPTPSGGSPSSSDVDELEEDVGTHLADMRAKEDIDTNSEIYRDAMNGFLTEQPEIISKDVKLKDYQLLGINWLLMLYRKGISGILADEMGLGKTAQVISFLGRLYEIGNRGPHLIIVPTSTLDNWLREFERFCPTLKVCAYYGTQDERMEMREHLLEDRDNYQVFVTTYTVATGSKDDRSFLRKLRCQSMILDEGHMVRNCTSARYQHLISLRTPFRLLLTGTPLQNNLQELVSLLMFILPDMLVEYEEEVRKIFKIKSVTTTVTSSASKSKKTHHPPSSAQILSRQRIARAKKMMTPFVLRRRKADVLKDLPKKIQVIEKCAMTKNQQALYDAILQESKQSYKEALDTTTSTRSSTKKREREGFEKFKNIVSQLRKAADHPLLFRNVYTNETLKKMAKSIMKEEQYWDANEEYIYEDMTVMTDFELDRLCKNHKSIKRFALKNQEWMDSGKVEKLKELLPAMKSKGNKVLLFSQFTKLLDILELVMDTLKINYLRLDGETKMADRQVLIDQFNEDKSIDVFLLSTKAGGFGINLTSANVVILYDMDFNPQNDRQAEDRAHRVGQTQDVTVIKLVADNSIEEHILSMAEIKLRLDRSVSGLAEEENEEEQKENVQSLLKSVLLS